MLAHSQLVTTDIYATGMITLSLYTFWRFLKLGGWPYAAVSALALGLRLWTIGRERRFTELARRLLAFSRCALFFVVNVNMLTGVIIDPEVYRWLRENFLPLDRIAYLLLVFRISAEDLTPLNRTIR